MQMADHRQVFSKDFGFCLREITIQAINTSYNLNHDNLKKIQPTYNTACDTNSLKCGEY